MYYCSKMECLLKGHYDYGLWQKVKNNFGEYLKNAKFKFISHIEIDKLILSE